MQPWRHNSSNVGGVTAGQARHNSSTVGGVTAGQVGHNSSRYNSKYCCVSCEEYKLYNIGLSLKEVVLKYRSLNSNVYIHVFWMLLKHLIVLITMYYLIDL